jgi:hypothetical protein
MKKKVVIWKIDFFIITLYMIKIFLVLIVLLSACSSIRTMPLETTSEDIEFQNQQNIQLNHIYIH